MVNFSVAVSALRTAFDRQAYTANNIANVSTPGFKSRRPHQVETRGGGTAIDAVRTNLNQGPLEPTGRSLDLAVSGRGFLAVDTAKGQRFTRLGSFGLDANGQLVDPAGNLLSPGLTVPGDAVAVNVGRDGAVSATVPDGSLVDVGQLNVFNFANPEGLMALGGGLFSPGPASGVPVAGAPGAPGFGEVLAGFLEGSNVSLAEELTDQIINRAQIGANLSSIRAQNDMLGEILDLTR